MQYKDIYIYTDGGSRGNPGPSALGVYITDDKGAKVAGFGRTLGITTNNVAEYQAIIDAFDWLLEHRLLLDPQATIHFRMDSKLACMQILGLFRIKNANLARLLQTVQSKEVELAVKTTYSHIPREENKEADAYVNKALDAEL